MKQITYNKMPKDKKKYTNFGEHYVVFVSKAEKSVIIDNQDHNPAPPCLLTKEDLEKLLKELE